MNQCNAASLFASAFPKMSDHGSVVSVHLCISPFLCEGNISAVPRATELGYSVIASDLFPILILRIPEVT